MRNVVGSRACLFRFTTTNATRSMWTNYVGLKEVSSKQVKVSKPCSEINIYKGELWIAQAELARIKNDTVHCKLSST